MQPDALSSASLEQRIEAASCRVDRNAQDMLQQLEDDIFERDYEERLYAQRAGEDRFTQLDDC